MSDDALRDLVAANRMGVLVTLERDGRPQLSDIAHDYDYDDWDEYRAAEVRDERLVVRLSIARVYGMI